MRIIVFTSFLVIVSACVNVAKEENIPREFSTVTIEKIFDKPISIRALKVTPDYIFFAGNKGKFGYLNTADHSVAYIGKIKNDSITPEFRAIGATDDANYVLSAGNPALLYKVNYFGKRKLIYQETGNRVFYDAMAFWNKDEGIAIGDPTDDCMSVITTKNGGGSWVKEPCHKLPKAKKGEAAFAASNSNIAIVGEKVWFVSGGVQSRVYYSENKGRSWEVYNTPLLDGKPTTGAYTLDFYDEKTGIVFGGDYTEPKNNNANKAITTDGGKTWELIADGKEPGYKSCVRFVPNSDANEIVAVGITGVSYSNDFGKSWKTLSTESFYTLEFINDFTAYASGKNGISKLTFIENGPKN